MKAYLAGFKQFVEDQMRGGDKGPSAKGGRKENYLDGMWRELGIDPNNIPEFIESGPIEISDEGLWCNQAIWKVLKPIDLKDHFVRIQYHKSLSPNLNQRCYVRKEDGQMVPFEQEVEGRTFLITIDKLAEMLSKPWQAAASQGGAPGGMPPGGPPLGV
jgi:hypothetical protein